MDPNNALMPAYSTHVAAPENIPQGMVAVFDVDAGVWSLASGSLFEQAPTQAPAPTLEQIKALAQQSIDAHFTYLYTVSVPSPAIAHEYTAAYTAAKSWLDSGMTGPVPLRVTAMAEGMSTPEAPVTEQQAAEFVVLKWQEADAVLDQRGAARLRAKAAIRAAVDEAAVFAAEAAGKTAMEAVSYAI
jgi:hypothetical protein